MSVCRYCDGTGVQTYGTVCYGIGPTRVYKVLTGVCWDCQGEGDAPDPVFHGLDQASLDAIFKEAK